MLQGLWKHYNYCPKAVRELKGLAESMQVRTYKAVKADGTRWVPNVKRASDVLLFTFRVREPHIGRASFKARTISHFLVNRLC